MQHLCSDRALTTSLQHFCEERKPPHSFHSAWKEREKPLFAQKPMKTSSLKKIWTQISQIRG